jgi:diacylglycerol kinase
MAFSVWHEWSLRAKDVGAQTRSVLSRAGIVIIIIMVVIVQVINAQSGTST